MLKTILKMNFNFNLKGYLPERRRVNAPASHMRVIGITMRHFDVELLGFAGKGAEWIP